MKNVLDHNIPIQRYFEEMTRIPHGSFHEKAYSDYLVNFAKEHGLSYDQDDMGNVVIRKPASPGYEDHPGVILQAHMDMVWAKDSDCAHDFETEPLDLYIEDGYLHARGTTLGADDGTGVAYMLAILESDTMCHPSLECIFTVQEEVGMFGAKALDKTLLKGRRFLGMDDGGAVSTMITSAGGKRMELSMPVKTEQIPAGMTGVELSIGGLLGGHSGSCIGKERGNAIKLMTRLICGLKKEMSVRLVWIDGGEKENAIPRDCRAVAAVPEEKREQFSELAARIFEVLREEYRYSDGGLKLEMKETEASTVFAEDSAEQLLELLYLLPTGLRSMNHKLSVPAASENLAVIRTEQGNVTISYSLRAESEGRKECMAEEIRILSKKFGVSFTEGAEYPAWPYREESVMRAKLAEAFKKISGDELKLVAVHGGVECGVFAQAIPDMDIVTFGSRGLDVHTPRERLDMKSFNDCFVIVTELLKNL